MAFAPISTHSDHDSTLLGEFVEKDYGNLFQFSANDDGMILAPPAQGGRNMEYPHKIWVGPLGEYRYAKVGKTVAHVITDEGDGGWVVEKWNIKKMRMYG